MRLLIRFLSIIAVLLLAPVFMDVLMAQGPPPPPPPPVNVPVDLGSGLILLIGAAIGAKKIYDHKKRTKAE